LISLKLTEDKKYFEIVSFDEDVEMIRLKKSMNKLDPDFRFSPRYTGNGGDWDGYNNLIERGKWLPSGLWLEAKEAMDAAGHSISLEGIFEISDFKVDKEELEKFSKFILFGLDYDPRDYQFDAFVKIMKYKYCTVELATSAGKTLVLFLVMKYLKWKKHIDSNNKFMIIVPKLGLLDQTFEKFDTAYNNATLPVSIYKVGGKSYKFNQKKWDAADVVIGTWQSIKNYPKEKLQCIRHIAVDECHTSKGKSISKIILSCNNLMLRFGVSGTIKVKPKYDMFFKVQRYLGPLVMRLSAKELIDSGYAPDVHIKMIYLKYDDVMTDDIRAFKKLLADGREMYENLESYGKDMYNLECQLIRECESRLRFITRLVSSLNANCIIMFNDIKNRYGKTVYEYLEDSSIETYYIDGDTPVSKRAEYLQKMEEGQGVALVASTGTFSTGIDSKNVSYIIQVESGKAEITIRQIIGRGMREFEGKIKFTLIDLVDTFGKYSKEHATEKLSIYKEQGFPFTKHSYNLKPI
jgi:superfamily II DNA or RNA helicase